MRKILQYSILLLANLQLAYSQSETDELIKYLFDTEAVEPQLADLETKFPFQAKKEILLTLGRQEYYNKQLEGDYKESYASHYYFIDLNEDNILDIVYNSADGADAPIVMIWIGTGDSYIRVVRQPGLLRFWNLEKGNFLIYEWAWMGEVEAKLHLYRLNGNRMGKNQTVFLHSSTLLTTPLQKISDFTVSNDNYNMRYSPRIVNEPCEEYPDGTNYCGNQYLTLNKGTKGTAISKSTDETGRIWWLAKIPLKSNNIRVGWLSSRYVEKN
ncbi:hypothetical protein [Ekhidna sp.]|uniref:hypothetical protein n=1 Tax=Ekhidna sp. TaxID=2608089 RepID=UPI003C7AD4EB